MGRCLSCREQSWAYSDPATLHEALLQAKDALGIGKGILCHIGVPLEDMTLVNFSLPLAARDDLPNAVRYALMRHVPFDLSDLRWEYTSRERSGNLEISVTLMQRAALNNIMERFSLAGIPVASVFPSCMTLAAKLPNGGIMAVTRGGAQEVLVWNGQRICWQSGAGLDVETSLLKAAAMLESYGIESRKAIFLGPSPSALPVGLDQEEMAIGSVDFSISRSFRIDLVPESTIRSLRRGKICMAVAGIALFLTLVFLPFRDIFVWQRRVGALEERLASLRTESETLLDIRQKNSAIEKRIARWAKHFSANAHTGQLIREITEILPPEAWLDSLQIQERKIIMSGTAPSATFVLEQLEQSPFFEEMLFDAPVTKQGQLEMFRIVGKISLL